MSVVSFLLFAALIVVALVALARFIRGDGWLTIAWRITQLTLLLAAVLTTVNAVSAAGGDGRVGSRSVSVGAGDQGIVVDTYVAGAVPGQRAGSGRLDRNERVAAGPLREVADLAAQRYPSGDVGRPRVSEARVAAPIPHTGRKDQALVLLSAVIGLVPLFAGLIALERLLRRAVRADAFTSANVRDLRWLAAVIGVGTFVAAMVDFLVAFEVLDGQFRGLVMFVSFPWEPMAIAVLLLALAEVWRRGIALQDDAQATI